MSGFHPAHVRACRTPDGIVLLDLRSGRYMGLGPDEGGNDLPFCAPINAPRDEVSSAEILLSAQLRVHYVAQLLLAYTRAKALLRWWSLEAIVSRVRRKTSHNGRHSAAHDASKIRSLVCSYRRLSPLVFTARNACLLDSLVLIDFLSQFALPATWVVGVQTQPFAAHSWVQHEDVVLNDSVEKVRSFTPILTV